MMEENVGKYKCTGTPSGSLSISDDSWSDASTPIDPRDSVPTKRRSDGLPPRPEKIARLPSLQSSSLPREGCSSSYRIFESHDDFSQSYNLHKWALNEVETEKLIKEISEKGKQVKVGGVYGCTRECLQFITHILKLPREPELSPEDSKEGILAFYKPDLGILCFFFKVADDAVYEKKPYPNSAREAIYGRLLFDLCSVVTCCPSKDVQRDWYFSSQTSLKYPFLPRIHKGTTTKFQLVQPRSTEIMEIEVKNSLQGNVVIHMSPDNFPHLFVSATTPKNTEKLIKDIRDLLKTWLEDKRSLLKRPKEDLDRSSMFTFSNALKNDLENSEEIVNFVNDRFDEMENQLGKMAQFICAELVGAFQGKYVLDEEHSGARDEFLKEAVDSFIETRHVTSMKKFIDQAKMLVLGFRGEDKSKTKAKKAVESFITGNIIEKWENCIDCQIETLQRELEDWLVSWISAMKMKTLAFKTCKVTCENEALVIRETGVQNEYTLPQNHREERFFAINDSAAFLYCESQDSFKALKFDPDANSMHGLEPLPHLKSSVLLASGSTPKCFVAFSNEDHKAYYGAASELKGIHTGIPVLVYGDQVSQVISACVLQRTKSVLLLNERGQLFSIELGSQSKQLRPVTVKRLAHNSEENYIETQFSDIKASDDETLYFLLTESAIEIYNLNFEYLKQIRVTSPRDQFKVLSDDTFNYVLVKSEENELRAYRFESEAEKLIKCVEKAKQEDIPGNPIIDILYYGFSKFGKTSHFTHAKPQLFLYSEILEMKLEIDDYISNLSYFDRCLKYRGLILPKNISLILKAIGNSPIDVEDLDWRLRTRTPIHLTSIQDGNIFPLQNGLNNFETFLTEVVNGKSDFVSAFADYTRLGSLEPIIKGAKNIKVISIMGKQNFGKSFLLNRIFGTRFDVAVNRCTDGIWVSVSKVKNQLFLVMDCEGLFANERVAKEETKLCLLLTAISDLTILNQDLTFNRHLTDVLTDGIDKLNGSKLFKGSMEIAIKDVAENGDYAAVEAANNHMEALCKSGNGAFLLKLFGGKCLSTPYRNFERLEQFDATVVDRRNFCTDSLSFRWGSGEELLVTLKIVMAQLFSDDATNIDSIIFQRKLERVVAAVEEAFSNPSLVQQLVHPANPTISVSLEIAGRMYCFSMNLFDVIVDLTSTYQVFDKFLAIHVDRTLFEHNEWYPAIGQFMTLYFTTYQDTVFNYVRQAISVPEDFNPFYDEQERNLYTSFQQRILLSHSLCLHKCENCGLLCLFQKNHSDNCDCSTDHRCTHACEICKYPQMCSLQAGHTEQHFCNTNSHVCGEPCELNWCERRCIRTLNHTDIHRCEAEHPCRAQCAVFEMCGRTCAIDQEKPHDLHNCGQESCPSLCCMKDCKSPCMSQDHLHYRRSSPDELYTPDTHQLLHFCNNPHRCKELCGATGVCNLQITSVTRDCADGSPYIFAFHRATRKNCMVPIPVKSLSHSGEHHCGAEQHRCTAKCPGCGAYCDLITGHSEVHTTATHKCREGIVEKANPEPELREDRHATARKLKEGEVAEFECCDSSCIKKGRGHCHPIECNGGSACLGLRYAGNAVHSDEQFLPDLTQKYDLVGCGLYWEHNGWESPVAKKSPDEQTMFALCPFYCASKEHQEHVFCQDRLFHSLSSKFKDHAFPCTHRGATEFDIAIVLDCTMGMAESFPQIGSVIANLTRTYPEPSIKFTVIGYTDHEPDNGYFDGSNPVIIYPPNYQLEDSITADVLDFVDRLRASGGGKHHGEAMLDGMNCVNMLGWRPGAFRMCFVISDDSPHGSVFQLGTTFPAGCDCGLDWKKLLQTMKTEDIELRLVKLCDSLGKTADLFSKEYGDGFEVIAPESMSNISEAVVDSITSVIEYHHSLA